ncbi:MAG: hypothetical protein R3B47_16165 [Bacteroidia bacterium]
MKKLKKPKLSEKDEEKASEALKEENKPAIESGEANDKPAKHDSTAKKETVARYYIFDDDIAPYEVNATSKKTTKQAISRIKAKPELPKLASIDVSKPVAVKIAGKLKRQDLFLTGPAGGLSSHGEWSTPCRPFLQAKALTWKWGLFWGYIPISRVGEAKQKPAILSIATALIIMHLPMREAGPGKSAVRS